MKKYVFFLLLLAGCQQPLSLGNDLDFDVPEEWKTDYECDDHSPLVDHWWSFFSDPVLNELEDQAIAYNNDLMIACQRIMEFRALSGIAFSDRLPHLYLNPSWNKEQFLLNLADTTPGSGDIRVQPQWNRLPLQLDYEFDFWGKYYHGNEAARARLVATEFGWWSVYNTLTTEVAIQYLTIRTLDEEIGFLEKTVDVRKVTIDINRIRIEAGLDPEIDLTRAELEYHTSVQELEDSKRLREITVNALAVLVGDLASCFSVEEGGKLPPYNPCFPDNLPSELLLRRPDVREKSQEVYAQLQEIGVAKANFFPNINLLSNIGYVSPQIDNFFEWITRYWRFVVDISQPLFLGGRLVNEQRAAESRYYQSVFAFRKQVQTAFQEVEDALNEIRYKERQYEAQSKAALAATDTAYLAEQQFKGGLINFLQVADAQRTQLDVEKLAIRLKGSQYIATVQLVRALGGGWPLP